VVAVVVLVVVQHDLTRGRSICIGQPGFSVMEKTVGLPDLFWLKRRMCLDLFSLA